MVSRSTALGRGRTWLVAVTLGCGVGAVAAPNGLAAVANVARVVGAAPVTQPLKLVFPLKVDAAGLARFATAVSTPGSPLYGRYASVAGLASRFGASSSARVRVTRFLRARGATHVSVDATGLLAEATLSVGLAERLFAAPLARFLAPDHTHFVAPVAATTVPAPLRGLVEGVVGLNTERQSTPSGPSLATGASRRLGSLTASSAASGSPSALPRSGTPAGCPAGMAAGQQDNNPGFTPNQYLTAYGFDPLYAGGFQGQGERVALIEIDGYSRNDVTRFAQCFGLPLPNVTPHRVNVSSSLPPMGEATLDLEVLTAAAPRLKAIDVYETNSNAANTLTAFAAPLEVRGRVPQVISASIGLCEAEAYIGSGQIGIDATERVLELAAAAGASLLAASGDNGSADCQTRTGKLIDTLGVNYPASSRWATSVGGTNLALNAANQIVGQSVWNDASIAPAAGGGGKSFLFGRPSYQAGVVTGSRREVPDVSMLADLLPGYSIYCTAPKQCLNSQNASPWLTVGGTSAGTPLLAGGVAIVDQMLRLNGHENLGLLNPLLYQLGPSTAVNGVFSDVISGDNDLGPYISPGDGQLLGCCTATPGWDDASGWGSVALANFAGLALNAVPKRIAISLSLARHQRPVARHGLFADVSCSAACEIGAYTTVRIGGSTFLAESKLVNEPAPGRTSIDVKFSSSQLRKLRSALRGHRKIVATVYGVLIDSLGEIQHHTAGKELRIAS